MKLIVKTLLISALVLSVISLSGCGFKPRRASDIPPQLRTLYFSSVQPFDVFSTQLKGILKALKITLVKKPSEAPFSLQITKYSYKHNDVSMTSTTQAVTYSFTLSITAKIVNRAGKTIVGPRVFSSTRSIMLNADQVLDNSIDLPAKQDMDREATTLLYQWLIASTTRQALAHAA